MLEVVLILGGSLKQCVLAVNMDKNQLWALSGNLVAWNATKDLQTFKSMWRNFLFDGVFVSLLHSKGLEKGLYGVQDFETFYGCFPSIMIVDKFWSNIFSYCLLIGSSVAVGQLVAWHYPPHKQKNSEWSSLQSNAGGLSSSILSKFVHGFGLDCSRDAAILI